MGIANDLMLPIEAMFESGVTLVSVHLRDGYVFFDNGCTLPITQMWDHEGEDVDDWREAIMCEFGNEEVGYGTVVMLGPQDRPMFH